MTLQEFKTEHSKKYFKEQKKRQRFHIALVSFLLVLFMAIGIGGVIGSSEGEITAADWSIAICLCIASIILLIWYVKRVTANLHYEYGNLENIKVYKAICTGKNVKEEIGADGNPHVKFYINYSLGDEFMEGEAVTEEFYYMNIPVSGECIIVQFGNSLNAKVEAFSIASYALETYDEPDNTNYLKKLAVTNITVNSEDIKELKTKGYTFLKVVFVYLAICVIAGDIGGIIAIITGQNVIGVKGYLLVLGLTAVGVGVLFVVYACNQGKKKKIQKWFKYLEESGISQIARSDARTAYNIYIKYPKAVTYRYVYSLNPAIEQVLVK